MHMVHMHAPYIPSHLIQQLLVSQFLTKVHIIPEPFEEFSGT